MSEDGEENCTSHGSSSAGEEDAASGGHEDFKCRWSSCGCRFPSLAMLGAHMTRSHAHCGDGGLFYCCWEGCGRGHRAFNARYKMLVHVRTHTNEKPHKCTKCNKMFSRSENLKIHHRSHTGERPYLCPVPGCSKAYSNSSDRFKHVRTHAQDKPYHCKVAGCGKRYTDPSSLRKHVKTTLHQQPWSKERGTLTQPETGSNIRDHITITAEKPWSETTYLEKAWNNRNTQSSFEKPWCSDNISVQQAWIKYNKQSSFEQPWCSDSTFVQQAWSNNTLAWHQQNKQPLLEQPLQLTCGQEDRLSLNETGWSQETPLDLTVK